MRFLVYTALALVLAFFVIPVFAQAHAATLNFDPTSVNVKADESFTLDIVVKTDEDGLGVDALLEFDPALLEAQTVIKGSFMTVGHQEIKDSQVYIVGYVDNASEAFSGEGTLASVTFKAKKAGTATISYVCELNDTRESNILGTSTDAPDLIDCSANGKAVAVITGTSSSGGSSAKSGSTPSSSGSSGSSGGSSELPRTGEYDRLISIAILGGVLCMIGIGARLMV